MTRQRLPEHRPITGSMMRDMTRCEHRVALDLFEDRELRDPVGAFTAMLWEDGCEHEATVLDSIAAGALDLRQQPVAERESVTAEALYGSATTILGGRIRHDDLLGEPDLLQRQGPAWVAGDVKSGAALNDGRPKKAYAAQVAHYADILHRIGVGNGRVAFILGRDARVVEYHLDERAGPRTPSPLESRAELLARARLIRDGEPTKPALSAECKGCHWKTICKNRLHADDDLTLIAELGRSTRDSLSEHAPSTAVLASLDPAAVARGDGPAVKGLSAARLVRFIERARLLKDPQGVAYARAPLPLARRAREFFLDVEADPLAGDVVYLHGILERTSWEGGESERFHAFFAMPGAAGERDAFAQALTLLLSDVDAAIYVYSAYERTSFRKLQARYPDVCSAAEIEALFDPARTVDLLTAIVRPLTEWPASDRSIQTLATLCGFKWRDSDPSGASSIEWYRSWLRTGDPALRDRILRYNEDDVLATRVLLDALLALPVRLA